MAAAAPGSTVRPRLRAMAVLLAALAAAVVLAGPARGAAQHELMDGAVAAAARPAAHLAPHGPDGGLAALLEAGEELDATRGRTGFISSAVKKVKSVAKKVTKHVVTKAKSAWNKVKAVGKTVVKHVKHHVGKVVHHVKKAVGKVVHHVKKAVGKVVHHVKKAVGVVFGVSAAEAAKQFANPPPPPPAKRPPPFRPPPPPPPARWDDKSRLTYQRFMCCYKRQDARPTGRTIRPELIDYRQEVLQTIPGLTTALAEGVRLQLTQSPAHVKRLVEMYERRTRVLQNPLSEEGAPEDPLASYQASPDMLGDIMWEKWCPASAPCTQDENCLISSLLLLNVLGAEGRNASPNVDGEQISPSATEVGPFVGQLDDPGAPNEYFQGAGGDGGGEASGAEDPGAAAANVGAAAGAQA